jgi:hypothetical protein
MILFLPIGALDRYERLTQTKSRRAKRLLAKLMVSQN